MSVSFIGQATGVTTATLPTHQAGDLILAFAYRDGNNTAPTVPSPFTAVATGTGSGGGGAANSSVVGSFLATGSDTSSGTWTNATSVVFHVYRGTSGAGAIVGTSATNSTSVTYPALTLQVTNGSSWVAGFAGHQSTNTALETAPTGMTNRSNVQDATDEAAGHDTDGGVSSWSQQTVNVGGTGASWRSWTVEIVDADTDPPTVTTFSPANAATGVLTGANIALTFNEAIQRGTGTITIRSGSASGTILESIDAATSGRLSISGSTLTIDPTNLLPVSTEVFVVIPSGAITDVSGFPSPLPYEGTSSYSFTTEAAPTVSTFNPASGATNVLTGANIALTLDKVVARGTGTITLRSGSASGTILESFDAASSGRISLSGSTFTVDPTALLPTSTQVFLVVPSGAITDTSGNAYAGTSSYSFTTEAAPVVSTFNPASGATGVVTNSNLVLSFSKTIARGTGTITLRSGSASGTILESFTAASSDRLTLSGSTLTVDPTALLPTNTQVFLVIPSGAVTDTSGNAYGGTSTYSFTTQTAPSVSTFSPASGATGVLTGSNVALTFDRAIARGAGTITIRSGSASGTILESLNAASSDRISISGSTVTIDPTALLPTSTSIFVVFPSGSVLDTIGNPYAGTSSYSFSTEAAPTVSAFMPASGATGVALDANLVLTFDKAVARGTGTLTLRKADNTVVETFNAASSDRISISGSTYTVDPTAIFDQQVAYFLDIPAGAITDTSGNAYAGTTSYTWTSILLGVLFPDNPSPGDTYVFFGRKWRYDGTGWERPLVSKLGDTVEGPLLASSTDHWRVPVGTTAQRTGTPLAGMIRFNTSRGCFEGYTGSAWVNMSPLNIDDIGATA
jgi:methionine-rich copper-binding protein CopC